MSRISYEIAVVLVDKLSHDDAFRERFAANPRAALAELGFEVPEADRGRRGRDPVLALEHPRGGLASKEKIAADSETLLASFQAEGSVKPYDICAG